MSLNPSNDLERILMKASSDLALRPEFYRVLKLSDVFVIGKGSQPDEDGKVHAGDTISIQNVEIEGKMYLAAFTSKEQLSRTLKEETTYYRMQFEDLLNLIVDTEIVINPYLEFGKILSIEEVAGLRDGSIWKPQKTIRVEEETQVMVGRPQNPPTILINALAKYFQTKDEVLSAYNLHYYNPQTDESPHTLICIEAPRSEMISSEVGIIVSNSNVPDPPVDVMFISLKDGFGKGMDKNYEPFYRRRRNFIEKIIGK